MADLKYNVIAVDKASGTFNAVGKSLANLGKTTAATQAAIQGFATGGLAGLTGKLGALSSSLGGLGAQFGLMIGAGGIGGLTAGVVQLLPQALALGDSFFGWATGLDSITKAYDALDPALKQHNENLINIQHSIDLMGATGSERARLEQSFVGQQIQALEKEREAREKAVLETKKWLALTFAGIPAASQVYEFFTGRLEEQEKALTDVTRRLAETQLKAVGAGKALGLEQAEEGKKRTEELTKALDKQRLALERIDQELEKRFGGNKPVIAPEVPMPILGPSLFARGEMTELMFKEAESIEELNQQALRTGIKRIETEFDFYNDQAKKSFDKINQMNERRTEEQKRQYEKMVDSIREGAGRVFDAMLTKGESVFSSLARFAESVLQTMLRNVFQNSVQALALGTGLGGLFGGGGGGRGGGAGGVAGAATQGGLSSIFGGLFGGGGAAAAATGGMGPMLGATAAAETTAAGGGLLGGIFGGGAGGALGLGGSLAAGAATAGIATAAILATSFISGMVQGGEQRRAQELARRAGIIQTQQFAAPETQTRFGIAGGAGYTVESDLTGTIRGIGKVPTVNNVINVQLIDARHAREAGQVIGEEVSRQILSGGSLLADNISWASS